MKILHVINNLGSGGAEKLLEDLVPLMNQVEGVEADILLLSNKNNVFEESLVMKKINLNIVKYNNIYDPRNVFEIIKIIRQEEYDIVHAHIFPTQYWVAISSLFLKNNKVKFITTEHSTDNRRRGKIYFKFIDKFVYSRYHTIISITMNVRESLLNWIDPNNKTVDKHTIIENGVDLNKINNALAYTKSELVPGIDENIKFICMVGRFSEAKDQETLIKAIKILSDNIHLILVGEGPLIGDIRKFVEKLDITGRVHFFGFRSDIPKILKTVEIVVLSSHWEGLSLASIEGLASGKPFVASRVNGLKEVVSGYGLMFDEGDDNELALLISKLINDNDFYQETVDNCLERSKQYSLQSNLEGLLTLYRSM